MLMLSHAHTHAHAHAHAHATLISAISALRSFLSYLRSADQTSRYRTRRMFSTN